MQCPIFFPDFIKVWSSSTHFSIEVPHIKFDRNPYSGSRIATTCRRTYGRTGTRLKGFLAAMRTRLKLPISPTECIYVYLKTVSVNSDYLSEQN